MSSGGDDAFELSSIHYHTKFRREKYFIALAGTLEPLAEHLFAVTIGTGFGRISVSSER